MKTQKGGIYFTRELYLSDAYLSLSKNGMKVLVAILDNRMRETQGKAKDKKGAKRKPKFINLDRLEIPYKTLEKKFKIPCGSIPRAIDDVLAKGFVTISHQGGAYKHDKNLYAWSDNYLFWKKGTVFAERKKDVKRGFQGKNLGAVAKHKKI
jgi:hypothetical protein